MVSTLPLSAKNSKDVHPDTMNNTFLRTIRYKIIGVLLILIIIISLSVLPLSRAIDQQVEAISITTELKHLTDRLAVAIIEQTEAERSFYLTRSNLNEQNFYVASAQINEIIALLEKTTQNNSKWKIWYKQVKLAVYERDQFLKNLMADARKLPPNATPRLNSEIEDNINSTAVIKQMLAFVEQEELLLKSNYQKLNTLRAILNYIALSAVLLDFFLAYFINSKLRRNIAQLKAYHNQLAEENALLETHVKERTLELEATTKHAQKERQRVEFLLQDASHRIGNSLATASSLLSIQINQSKNDEIKSALIVARDHIQTLATAHRRLRLSEEMDTTDTKEFFETIIKDIASSLPPQRDTRIYIKNHIQSFKINSRDATTLAIIIGELITNATKHAFTPNKDGNIEVMLFVEQSGKLKLIVEDNGRGFPPDMNKSRGLGKLIISKLCAQFETKPIFENTKDGGARTSIILQSLNFLPFENKP